MLGEGEELVVAVALALSLCPAFLDFSLFRWFSFRGEGEELVVAVALALSLCPAFLDFSLFRWFSFRDMLCSVLLWAVMVGFRMCSGAQ